jgi:translation initiation factor IF-3
MFEKKYQQRNGNRVNNQIRFPQVMVIGKDGDNLGVMTPDKARWLARQDELDLVEVAPNARPPVCRIMDYGKFKYEESQKQKAQKKTNQPQLKEIRLGPNTGDNDILTKINACKRFIENGDRVLVQIVYKKRQNAHKELGATVMTKILEAVKDAAHPQHPPKFLGNNLTCVLEPNKA